MGNNDKHFWGSREHRKSFWDQGKLSFKTLQGTRGSINEEQWIKSKEIKRSCENVLSLPMDGLFNFQRLSNFELKSKKQTRTGNLLRQSQSLGSPICFLSFRSFRI